ncbi:MAG TPA: hypothetical protein VF702_14440 [Allosphingosinicella sp.]|jgi:hypothetical protein
MPSKDDPPGPGTASERGRWARWFVLVPILHVGACAADLMSEQVALMGFFCTGSDHPLLSWAVMGLVLASYLSLPFGFFAIRFRRLRLLYFVLIALIPILLVGIDRLVAARILTCDGP